MKLRDITRTAQEKSVPKDHETKVQEKVNKIMDNLWPKVLKAAEQGLEEITVASLKGGIGESSDIADTLRYRLEDLGFKTHDFWDIKRRKITAIWGLS